MSESITRESISLTGLPGATFNGRLVGTVSGAAPTTGTFLAGDFVIDQTGKTWVCTLAGSPGTWSQADLFTGGTVGNLTVSGSLTVSGTTIISGANTIYGSTNLSGTNTFNGGTFYNSPLFNTSTTYSGNVTVGSGNLTVTSGTTTLSGTQNFYGATLLSGALNIYSPTVGGVSVFSGAVMTYNGTQWVTASGASGGSGVSTFSAGTTGLTPATATSGAVALGGTLGVANGGLNTTTAPAVGSIPVGSSTSAYTPLAIGTNGQVLTSNGTTASWAAAGGGLTAIATVTTIASSSSFSFSGIPQTYKNLRIVGSFPIGTLFTGGNITFGMIMNSITTTTYNGWYSSAGNGASGAITIGSNSSGLINNFAGASSQTAFTIDIPMYTSTTQPKVATFIVGNFYGATGVWQQTSTAAITSLTFNIAASSAVVSAGGIIYLYGFN